MKVLVTGAKELARTYSYGGGCGVNISNLRPKGSRVKIILNTYLDYKTKTSFQLVLY